VAGVSYPFDLIRCLWILLNRENENEEIESKKKKPFYQFLVNLQLRTIYRDIQLRYF